MSGAAGGREKTRRASGPGSRAAPPPPPNIPRRTRNRQAGAAHPAPLAAGPPAKPQASPGAEADSWKKNRPQPLTAPSWDGWVFLLSLGVKKQFALSAACYNSNRSTCAHAVIAHNKVSFYSLLLPKDWGGGRKPKPRSICPTPAVTNLNLSGVIFPVPGGPSSAALPAIPEEQGIAGSAGLRPRLQGLSASMCPSWRLPGQTSVPD